MQAVTRESPANVSRVQRFRALHASVRPRDAVQFVILAGLLVVIEAGLRVARVDRMARLLRISFLSADTAARDEVGPPSLTSHERRWINNALRLMRHWPLNATCLRRSMVFGWILRRRHPVLLLGVRQGEFNVLAHAWIRVGNTDLDPTASQYTSFGLERVGVVVT
jgi:hypothetical protein